MLKIIRVKNFHGVKFLQFRSIHEIFLTVDDYNKDERLEQPSIWSTTRYQESQVSLAVVVDWTLGIDALIQCTVYTHVALGAASVKEETNSRNFNNEANSCTAQVSLSNTSLQVSIDIAAQI